MLSTLPLDSRSRGPSRSLQNQTPPTIPEPDQKGAFRQAVKKLAPYSFPALSAWRESILFITPDKNCRLETHLTTIPLHRNRARGSLDVVAKLKEKD